jgi:cob(I)alamin adenosyltransferase
MGKRLSKIYTRTGDKGETGLGDGSRIPKDHARIHAIGSVDELNSQMGLVIEEILLSNDNESLSLMTHFLKSCQHRIFDLGGEMSIPGYIIITSAHVTMIETHLDQLNENLEPLANFILPGGSRLIASLHVARSVCRRAEREVIAVSRDESVNIEGIKFLNRLSDYLFVAARYAAKELGIDEVLWVQDDSTPSS